MPVSYDLNKDEIAALRRMVLRAIVRDGVSYKFLERESGVPQEDIQMFVAYEPLTQDQMLSLRAYLMQREKAQEEERIARDDPFKKLYTHQSMKWLLHMAYAMGLRPQMNLRVYFKMNPYRQKIEEQKLDRKLKDKFLKEYKEELIRERMVMMDGDSFRLWWARWKRHAKNANLPVYKPGLAQKARGPYLPRHLRPSKAPAAGDQKEQVPPVADGSAELLIDRAAVGGAREDLDAPEAQERGEVRDLDGEKLERSLPG